MKFQILIFIIILSCSKMNHNTELLVMFNNDQIDRKNYDYSMEKNDKVRLKRVYKLSKDGKILTDMDYYRAALILLHGNDSLDYKNSNQFAKMAIHLNPNLDLAKILFAQSLDRYLLSIGKKQHYGSQKILFGDKLYLAPIDIKAISNQQREEMKWYHLDTLLKKLNLKNKLEKKKIEDYYATEEMINQYIPKIKVTLLTSMESIYLQLRYPKEARKNSITGLVKVQYRINTNGEIVNPFVVDGLGFGCDEEAIRLVKLLRYKSFENHEIDRRINISFQLNE